MALHNHFNGPTGPYADAIKFMRSYGLGDPYITDDGIPFWSLQTIPPQPRMETYFATLVVVHGAPSYTIITPKLRISCPDFELAVVSLKDDIAVARLDVYDMEEAHRTVRGEWDSYLSSVGPEAFEPCPDL